MTSPPSPELPAAARTVAPPHGELWAQLRLSAPLAAQQAGLQVMGAVDTAVLGHFSATALAGAGVGGSVLFSITCIGMGILLGLDSVLPRALGAGRPEETERALGAGVRLAIALGLALTAAVLCAPALLPALGTAPEVAEQARVYLYGRAPGVLPFLLTCALRPYLVAHNVTWPVLAATIGGNVLNAGADVLLVFGDRGLVAAGLPALGLPALGTLGAALASSLVQLASLAIYARAVSALRGRGDLPGDPALLRQILHHGVPIGLQLVVEVGVFSAAGVVAAHFGTAPAAAHSLALSIAAFSFSTAVGIGSATATRVGLAVGLGGPKAHVLARRRGLLGLGQGLLVMATAALAFWLVPRPIAAVFTSDPQVLALALPLLGVAAVFQLFDGAQAVLAGALRGVGRTRAALAANVVGHYVVGLPISLGLAFGLGYGVIGVWIGLSAGLVVTSLLLLVHFARVTARPLS